MQSSKVDSTRLVVVLAAIFFLMGAPSASAQQRLAAEVRMAESRFFAVAEAWRKNVVLVPAAKTNATTVDKSALAPTLSGRTVEKNDEKASSPKWLTDIRFVYEKSPVPRVESIELFGERVIVVSDGWMALAEDLVRAALVYRVVEAEALDSRRTCFVEYSAAALNRVQENLKQKTEKRLQQPRVVPRLVDFRSAEIPEVCDVRSTDLKGRKLDSAVAAGLEAGLVWLIAQQAFMFERFDVTPQQYVVGFTPMPGVDQQTACRKSIGPNPPAWTTHGRLANGVACAVARRMNVDLQKGFAAVLAYSVVSRPGLDNEVQPNTWGPRFAGYCSELYELNQFEVSFEDRDVDDVCRYSFRVLRKVSENIEAKRLPK